MTRSFDPEFDTPSPRVKGDQGRRQGRRFSLPVLLLIGLWLLILWSFDLLFLFLAFAGLIVGGVLIIALAMVPSLLGYFLFGLYDRLVAAFRRAGKWPEDEVF